MFTRFLYIIAIAFIIFLVGGLFLPRLVHVERSIEIDRPPGEIFEILNGFQSFSSWSPWLERDPGAAFELSGPEFGVGARMSWTGDPRLVGTGWQEITESQPDSLIRSNLFFDQQGPATVYFQLDETERGVQVTWGFDSDLTAGQGVLGGFLARYFGLLFDKWVGTDYEHGLANLKSYAESIPQPVPLAPRVSDSARPEIEIIDVPALDILYITSGSHSDAHQDSAELAQNLAVAYREISLFMAENELEMSAQPMAITRAWSDSGYQFDAAIPVYMKPLELSGNVLSGHSPSGLSVRLVHRGPYEQMRSSYEKLAAYMVAHDLPEGDVSWEQYISDPGETAAEDLITHIYFQIGIDSEQP